jgi:hypothetical protein
VFCGSCGRENLDEVQFCVGCGANLAAQRTPPPPSGGHRAGALDPTAPPLPPRSGPVTPVPSAGPNDPTIRSPFPGPARPRTGRRDAVSDVSPVLDRSVGAHMTGGALATPPPPSGGFRSPPVGRSVGFGRTGGVAADDDTAALLAEGDTLAERYVVRALLGRGGMGAVYRVTDSIRGVDVALKVMLPSLLLRERALERFVHEAELALRLAHDGIVRVFDVGEDRPRGLRFYTMELVEGLSLRDWIEEKRKLHEEVRAEEALKIVGELLEALAYAHQTTVHRDLKPENVMLMRDGRVPGESEGVSEAKRSGGSPRPPGLGLSVKILDFGIAKLQEGRQLTSTSTALGTVYYMAPEQQTDAASADARADLYSVAVILYELLTGRLPVGRFRLPSEEFARERERVGEGTRAERASRKALSPKIDALLLRGLEADPARRQPSAQAMLAELREAERQLPGGAGGGARPGRAWKVALGVVIAGIAIGGGVAVLLPKLPPRDGSARAGKAPVAPAREPAASPEQAKPPSPPSPREEPAVAPPHEERRSEPTPPPAAAAAPAIVSLEPADGAVVRGSGGVDVRGRVEHEVRVVTVNGIEARLAQDGTFAQRVPAAERLAVRASGPGGEDGREVRLAIDDDPPEIRPDLPPRSVVAEDSVALAGEVRDAHPGATVLVDGVAHRLVDGRFRAPPRRLAPGANTFKIEASDAAGNTARTEVVVVLDADAPQLELDGGAGELLTNRPSVTISGRVVDANPLGVEIGGRPRVDCDARGAFSATLPLSEGENAFEIRAVDAAGNRSPPLVRRVVLDTQAPEVRFDAPPAHVAPGSVEVGGAVSKDGCEVSVDGAPAAVEGRRFRATVQVQESRTVIALARDRARNEGRGEIAIAVAADLGEIVRLDAGFRLVVVRAEARGAVKVGDIVEALHAGRPVGKLKVTRVLKPTADAPEGSFSTEPDRGGPVEPFHVGDRVRIVKE